jgi:adenylosuccinate synthase
LNLIGTGTVVHIPSFFAELEAIQKKGLDSTDRIFISDRAHLVFDLHQLVDGLEEVELGAGNIGTTRKGIGPTYSTKAARSGIRVYELFNWPEFEKKLGSLHYGYKQRFGDLLKYNVEEELARYKVYVPLNVAVACASDCDTGRSTTRHYGHMLLMLCHS